MESSSMRREVRSRGRTGLARSCETDERHTPPHRGDARRTSLYKRRVLKELAEARSSFRELRHNNLYTGDQKSPGTVARARPEATAAQPHSSRVHRRERVSGPHMHHLASRALKCWSKRYGRISHTRRRRSAPRRLSAACVRHERSHGGWRERELLGYAPRCADGRATIECAG